MARALDLPLDGREFNSLPPRLVLGWVTILRWANYLNISPSHPGQFHQATQANSAFYPQ